MLLLEKWQAEHGATRMPIGTVCIHYQRDRSQYEHTCQGEYNSH
jgi:hypothetical protein